MQCTQQYSKVIKKERVRMFQAKALCVLSLIVPLHGMDLNNKREILYRNAGREKISYEDAYEAFPKHVSMDGKLQFLKLFLYERVKPCNRNTMISAFSKVANLPHKKITKLLNDHRVRRKSFLNTSVRCGKTLDEADVLWLRLTTLMTQIDSDQENHRETKEIYETTMSTIFARRDKDHITLNPPHAKSKSTHTKQHNTPSLLTAPKNSIYYNRFALLADESGDSHNESESDTQ
jgi:hypothetical protein